MFRKSFYLATVMACSFVLAASLRAQTAEEASRELIKTMKVEEQYKQMATSMAAQLGPVLDSVATRVPEEKRAAYKELAKKVLEQLANGDSKEMIDAAVKVYATYYTVEELKGLNEFYSTPLGQKLMTTTPKITADLMGMTMQWNQGQTGKIMEELVKQFPELNGPAAAAPAPAAGGAPAQEHQHQ